MIVNQDLVVGGILKNNSSTVMAVNNNEYITKY